MKLKKGFTLVEVLITLGIIGVVVTITIPTLIKKYQEKVVVNQVVKTYAMLNEAFRLAINDYGTVDEWCSIESVDDYQICAENMRDILSKYLKVTKICTNMPTIGECMNGNFKYISTHGEKELIFNSYYFRAMRLSNGIGITFDARNWGNSASRWCKIDTNVNKNSPIPLIGNVIAMQNCGLLYVDINGNKGPNRNGVDLFAFSIRRNGLVGHGAEGIHSYLSFAQNCLTSDIIDTDQSSGACTAWVLQNKNLDYLYCPEKLGWNKAMSCQE